ncbi:bifunctional folylpolyglutamate synthase/dihydrofolate synthase [Microbacterium amylolyticum]|uniref:tetrahydrofolate synthase n=1 Tax=Microbacterium amylolyticum TaxID=936337 RepID=A0ABS4ZEL8_9MICO|nr:folylpolyglutamate synthase/dihydrofolate synthase family protein [Microbacterium amylolyticum]MBP2435699.1 dihydrofolate synthase/folylpolyglutamate synthase [Microbacterium amylolyticum]
MTDNTRDSGDVISSSTPSDRRRADDAYAKLLARAGERWVQPRLERTARLLEYLDNPQRTYRVVHITGTNGKTSTARMIESLIRAHGLRTGLFTSPHLVRFTERILIDGRPIDDSAVAEAWDELAPFLPIVDAELAQDDQEPLTFFEVLTALAFVACADAPVDVLVLEVGMGGAWDSTNTADGDVAVFTPIALDHADRLGSTIEEIARVKAGIIKPGSLVVSAQQEPAAAAVLREVASDRGTSVAFEGSEFSRAGGALAVGGQLVTVQGLAGRYDEEFLPLFGAHQGDNVALAVAAVESLIGGGEQRIAPDVLTEGFAESTSPGRMQLIGTEPTVLVDAAHNPHGAAALVQALEETFDVDEWGVVFGAMADKDIAGIIEQLRPVISHLFATEANSDRSASADEIADIAEAAYLRPTVHRDIADAADAAREWAAEGQKRAVVIVGSIVLGGEAIALARAEGWKKQGTDR